MPKLEKLENLAEIAESIQRDQLTIQELQYGIHTRKEALLENILDALGTGQAIHSGLITVNLRKVSTVVERLISKIPHLRQRIEREV
jgi:hypothetical protein